MRQPRFRKTSSLVTISLLLVLPASGVWAQGTAQTPRTPGLTQRPAASPDQPPGLIQVDALVTDKAGQPVRGLAAGDFTVLDNGRPDRLVSVHASDGSDGGKADPPVEVVLLIDAANVGITRVAYEQTQIDQFLRQNGGHLALPVNLMILTDRGVLTQPSPSTDGLMLAKSLDQRGAILHDITRSSGFYGAEERLNLSLKALDQIATVEGRKPGRKLLLWIGPGWPYLSGPSIQYSSKSQQGIFNTIVSLADRLREGRIELDSVYPADLSDNSLVRSQYYRQFLKPVRTARQVEGGDLAVEVLAVHSGGRAIYSGGDIAQQIATCLADAGPSYRLSFEPAKGEHDEEYHDLQIKVARPDTQVRTVSGFYTQPGLPAAAPAPAKGPAAQ